MQVPKKIHQIWYDAHDPNFRGYPPSHPIYRKYADSWKRQNPDFEYRLWNNRDIDALFAQDLPQFHQFFVLGLKKVIEKCDFARYAILYLEGGVYVDLDFECFRNIGPLIENRSLGFVLEPRQHQVLTMGEVLTSNSFFISEKRNPFWLALMEEIRRNYDNGLTVISRTGPLIVSRTIAKMSLNDDRNFISTCLIEPYTQFRTFSHGCTKHDLQQAFCSTKWNEGTYWWKSDAADLCVKIVRALFLVLVGLTLAALLLGKLKPGTGTGTGIGINTDGAGIPAMPGSFRKKMIIVR
ncbi:MAG: glycosyltransferase family 32 protein [Sulfobacillus sp.]